MSISWLFIGHLISGQTSLMRMQALRRCGVEVHGYDTRSSWNRQNWLQRRLVSTTERGAFVKEVNQGIVALARKAKPTYAWFDKQEYVHPQTLQDLRALGTKLIYYTPDPYFTLSWKRTRLMDSCLPLFDLLITSKTYELDEFSQVGPQIMYLPLGYCDEVHRPLPVRPEEKTFVGFVGGWEPRRQAIMESLRKRGMKVKIWGYGWDHLIDGRWSVRRYMRLRQLAGKDHWQLQKSEPLHDCIAPGEVYADAFAKALSSATVGLGFLRTICPDQHTTRSFEIPACASMLLADRTAEHQAFFEEGKEAEFFSSEEELVEKAVFYNNNLQLAAKIAEQGRARCVRSGYSYVHRMQAVIDRVAKG